RANVRRSPAKTWPTRSQYRSRGSGDRPRAGSREPEIRRQLARPAAYVADGPDPGLGLVRVVEEAELPAVGRFQPALVNRFAVEGQGDDVLLEAQHHAVPLIRLEWEAAGAAPVLWLVDDVIRRKLRAVILCVGHPVDLDP